MPTYEGMAIEVTCSDSRCGEGFVCLDEEAGKTVFCPHCKSAVVAPDASREGLPAQTVGAYRLIRKIAHGGMGEIYEAVQLKLDRRVALKTLSESLSGDSNYLKRFKREARAAASVNHPGVVQVYDSGEEDGLHYLVMELIEGNDLAEIVKREGKLAVDETLRIVREVAEALREALVHGVIHRDIKPANIMLTQTGQVKVSDLGLAKVITDETDLTMSGVGLGSPHFIAPEQADDARRVDHRADIYSLGITTLFLLTGKRPFEGSSAFSVVVAQANKPLPSGKELGTELPSGVETLILKMTAKRPSRRYPDYDALLADLRLVRSNPEVELTIPPESPADLENRRGSVSPGRPKDSAPAGEAAGLSPKARVAAAAALVVIVALVGLLVVSSSSSSYEGVPRGFGGAQTAVLAAADPGDFTTNGLVKLIERLRVELPEIELLLPTVMKDYAVDLPSLRPVKSNPLAEESPDTMLAAADAFAAASPEEFKEILARYDQVKTAAAGAAIEARAEEMLKQWAMRYLSEVDRRYQRDMREMGYFLEQHRPRSAEDLWRQFPQSLRSPPVDRLIAEVLSTRIPAPPGGRDRGRGGPPGKGRDGGKGGPRGQGPPREGEFGDGQPRGNGPPNGRPDDGGSNGDRPPPAREEQDPNP